MALSIKIVANDTDILLSFALMIGPIAAMALPQHIAVPVLTRYEVLRSIFRIL